VCGGPVPPSPKAKAPQGKPTTTDRSQSGGARNQAGSTAPGAPAPPHAPAPAPGAAAPPKTPAAPAAPSTGGATPPAAAVGGGR
jgi:hypothetical protein